MSITAGRRAKLRMAWKRNSSQVGIGIAMVTLIESTVRVTIRNSDSAPIASEAATALVSSGRSNGCGAAVKACCAGRPYHGRNPLARGRITRDAPKFAGVAGKIGATPASKMAKWRRTAAVMSAISQLKPRRRCRPDRRLQRRAASPWRRNPGVCSTRRNHARIAGNVARS